MNPVFIHDRCLLKRQVLAMTGIFRYYDLAGNLIMFSQQKMFKLREDIRVFSDESKTNEVLQIKARQILDFSAAYDVIDSAYNQKVGALRRRGMQSILRDEWEVLDANDQVIGKLIEDNMEMAMLRRFLLGNFLPQNYDIIIDQKRVADLKQRFNLFRYELDVDFTFDNANVFDRRVGLAAGILLATVEGRQSNSL